MSILSSIDTFFPTLNYDNGQACDGNGSNIYLIQLLIHIYIMVPMNNMAKYLIYVTENRFPILIFTAPYILIN